MSIRTIRGANLYNRVTPPGFPVVLGRLRPDPKGAQYAVVNTSNAIAPVGKLHIPPSGLTLRVNEVGADGKNRAGEIASLEAGDKLQIKTLAGVDVSEATLNLPPIENGDVFAIQVLALPVAPDGDYIVTGVKV